MILKVLFALICMPLIGGLIVGADRKLTARMQGRFGPPLLQPFYDVVKLCLKQRVSVNEFQVLSVFIYFASSALSVLLLLLRSDLLMIIFVMSIGAAFLVVGAMSVRSPYSQVGAQRELMQMLSYEPLLILVTVGMYLVTGSFKVSKIMMRSTPMIAELPLLFFVMIIILGIKMRKSPFDISASEHAHQEIVKGVLTDYSGPYLAMTEVAHWYDLTLLLSIAALFFYPYWIWGIISALALVVVEILIDNVSARLTVKWMLSYSYIVGITLAAVNIGVLYFVR